MLVAHRFSCWLPRVLRPGHERVGRLERFVESKRTSLGCLQEPGNQPTLNPTNLLDMAGEGGVGGEMDGCFFF